MKDYFCVLGEHSEVGVICRQEINVRHNQYACLALFVKVAGPYTPTEGCGKGGNEKYVSIKEPGIWNLRYKCGDMYQEK